MDSLLPLPLLRQDADLRYAAGWRLLMCMCGEIELSYVCMAHRGTRFDWRMEHVAEPESSEEERYRLASEYVELVVEPALRRAA